MWYKQRQVTSIPHSYWWEFCCIYMNFRINLTQFYINLSRQFLSDVPSDITFMGREQELKWIAFCLYLSFFLYSPFKGTVNSDCNDFLFIEGYFRFTTIPSNGLFHQECMKYLSSRIVFLINLPINLSLVLLFNDFCTSDQKLLELNTFQSPKNDIFRIYWSEKGSKGTVVNWAWPSLSRGSIAIITTVKTSLK